MFVMLAQQLDEALGLSNLTNMITQYLPAEHVASLTVLKEQLPATLAPPSPAVLLVWAMAAIMALAVFEQLKYQVGRLGKGGKQLPGPSYTVPFLGSIVEMVQDPHAFWERQRAYSFPGLSWNSIVTKFTVMVTDPAVIRHVFHHNSKDTLLLDLHPNAKMILGTRNIAFMHGPEHKALRKSFLALFTRKALSMYVQQQDGIIRSHISSWLDAYESDPTPCEVRDMVRDMNCATSQKVFIGPYLDDPKVAKQFTDAYMEMVAGFLTFPLKFPGTAVWRAMKGRQYILKVLEQAAIRSKESIRAGKEPSCLLDFWTQQILTECDEAAAAGVPPPKYSHNKEMAYTVMDFLFASQDASTASLVWVLTLMAEHPEVLERVRAEQAAARPDLNATITGETLAQMPYTRQVIKEVLRYRPPAPMVPQVAMKPFKLTDNYTAPRGAFIIPDIISACRQGYTEGERFDPDRFSPERKEDVTYAGNYLVFGHGPHYCVGKEYAINHLITFLAILSTSLDWTRFRTPDSERIKYLPTIYPYDSVITMWARTAQPPAGAESNGTDVFSTLDAAAAGGLRQRSSSRPQRA